MTIVEEIRTEGGREVSPPARVAVVAAVIENPWAGQGFVEDLAPGIDATASDVGALLAPLVLEALEAPAEAYGKAAIVGLDGEVEHGSGLIHTLKFGDHFRKAANATTLLPAVEKRGPAGVLFDIPLKHITDATIRSHHQTWRCGSPTPRTPTRSWWRSPPPPRAVPSSGWHRCRPSSEMTRPTLVLLHGVGLDHTMWDPVVALLAGDADVRDTRPAGPRCASTAHPRASRWPTWPTASPPRSRPARIWSVSRSAPWSPSTWPCTGPTLVATLTSVSSVCRRTAEGARGSPGPSAHRRARFRRERRGVAAPVV